MPGHVDAPATQKQATDAGIMARFSIAEIALGLDEFRKLPLHIQGRALLKALADRYPRDTFNRHNLLLEPYGTIDHEGFTLGWSQEERRDALKHLLGAPWRYLINNDYIALTEHDFYEVTTDGHVAAAADISSIKVDRTIIDALRFLHPDLQGHEHYFREGKLKEAVTAAFIRVENRLNEIRDASLSPAAKGVSGVGLPYKLFDTGDLKFPYPTLGAGDPQARAAYEKQLKGYLTSGIGWFRNSFGHEPHNLPTLNDGEALELLFVASHMLRMIDRSI
jgi:Protein of unknown function (Hypoth_ymh)